MKQSLSIYSFILQLHVAILPTQRKGIIICFEASCMFWTLECKIFTHISLACLSQIKGNTKRYTIHRGQPRQQPFCRKGYALFVCRYVSGTLKKSSYIIFDRLALGNISPWWLNSVAQEYLQLSMVDSSQAQEYLQVSMVDYSQETNSGCWMVCRLLAPDLQHR